MFKQDFKKTIVICIDIDNTFCNPQTSPPKTGIFDINGEAAHVHIRHHDCTKNPIGWYRLLEKMQDLCATYHVDFRVHIITAKLSGTADNTVDAAVTMLHPFLKLCLIKLKKHMMITCHIVTYIKLILKIGLKTYE